VLDSNIAISVEGLSKRYLVGHLAAGRERYTALRDVIGREAGNIVRRTLDLFRGGHMVEGDDTEEFWALKDVSFQVKRGEVIGIIGRNGAGKSTLLKILSRITEPTAGRAVLRGRIASLLEVGTGFHPELTGRENIFLNGAVLGMSRAEVRRKFDEIVAFADVEKFLDTPVKRYSSGMYVRLAFAVAAHLEPEILAVDEVLAVGDAEFQKKCLGKMDDQAREGRTVLFVTHDMRRAAALCSRGILLRSGRVAEDGPMSQVIENYLTKDLQRAAAIDLTGRKDRTGTGEARFQSIALYSGTQEARMFSVRTSFSQRLRIQVDSRIGPVSIITTIVTSDGIAVYQLMNTDDAQDWCPEAGSYTVSITTDRLPLYPGTYMIDLWLGDRNHQRVDYIPQAISFNVVQEGGDFVRRELHKSGGLVVQNARWNFDEANGAATKGVAEIQQCSA
jgi:lipopolysaccharide transport system ATP-binding protein